MHFRALKINVKPATHFKRLFLSSEMWKREARGKISHTNLHPVKWNYEESFYRAIKPGKIERNVKKFRKNCLSFEF